MVVASPRTASAASTSRSVSASRAASQPSAWSRRCFSSVARSFAAIARAAPALTYGASPSVTAKIVRRIDSSFTSETSPYSARSTSAAEGSASRAQADRYTVAASVACRPTTASATSSTRAARAEGANSCRRPNRARRSPTPITGTLISGP